MSATYDHIKGNIILVATLEAQPGKGDELERVLMDIHASSNSDAEPGCFTYRVSRSKNVNGDKFVVFEEYADGDAVKEHMKLPQFATLSNTVSELATGPPNICFYEECLSNKALL